MKIDLEFDVSIAAGEPKLKIYSQHTDADNYFILEEGVFCVSTEIDLAPVDQLRIRFYDKVHFSGSKDTVVELKKIKIDGINLQQFLFKGKFYPCYNENFYRDFSPPDYYQPGTKMYHNGVFVMDVKTPIWKFLMDSHYA
jgi:hypothetical protein